MTNRQILETMSGTGYELDKTETFLPRDTICIYKAKKWLAHFDQNTVS